MDRPEWQDLPQLLSGTGEEIDKAQRIVTEFSTGTFTRE